MDVNAHWDGLFSIGAVAVAERSAARILCADDGRDPDEIVTTADTEMPLWATRVQEVRAALDRKRFNMYPSA